MVGRMQAPVLALFVACAGLIASPLASAAPVVSRVTAPIRTEAQTAALPPSIPTLGADVHHAPFSSTEHAAADAARERRGSEPRLVNLGASPRGTLRKCQGDCDRDSDCQGSLKCFQRNGYAKVPGCAAGGSGDQRNYDYCYEPSGSTRPSPPPPPPKVCTTGSVGTDGMLDILKPAATNFQKCHDSVKGIADNLTDLKRGVKHATEAADKMQRATGKIKAVLDKVNDKGIANILGKIPKVGLFIKMGLKAAGKVATPVDKLAKMTARAVKKVELAVKITEKTFSKASRITGPVAMLLTGGHAALDAAHTCAAAAGYECGSAEGDMELANQRALARGRDNLATISRTGEVCSEVLNPVDTAIAAIAAMARQLAPLLKPFTDVLAAIEAFVRDMEKFIDDFTKALSDSTAVQCTLEIFEPVTDFFNLATCPVDEAFRAILDTMMDKVSDLVNKATTQLITEGVEALVPDDLRIEIPDFRPNLPTGTWLATCTAASLAFPEHSNVAGTFWYVRLVYGMQLPHTITGEQIEQQILDEVLAKTRIDPLHDTGYNSACEEAWKELGTDYEACSKASYDRGVGEPLQYRGCQTHYEDFGLTCTRVTLPNEHTYFKLPLQGCRTDYEDWGAWCTRVWGGGTDTYFKSTYCSAGLEEDPLWCYKKCKTGYHGVGSVCWINQ